ncbi:MAG: phosphate ABC transporter permease subunit PstC [Solirubrobacterales bacterium]|nr:phosphate ABC transporter permease subunit PstC [Solirubrobacterales bacterium]
MALPSSSGAIQAGGRRWPLEASALERSTWTGMPDRVLRYGLSALALAILGLIVFFFVRLVGQAQPAFSKFGVVGFVFTNNWNVNAEQFGALPLVVGTLITSGLALLMGVPVAVAAALYLSELCPRVARGALTILLELLAAVPSVVYGLWGIFFLAPKLQPAEQWVADRLSFVPFIGGGVVTIPNYFIAGLILAIMILPIVSAISREVMATVPADHKEASLALGATRWEMIRMAVLPYCRSGIVGGAMLGLGRAIGETIAVTIVIGNAPQLGKHLFGQGYTLAAVIANEFGEATGLHRSALFAAGLVLFVLTLIVNALARLFVIRAGRRTGGPTANVEPEPGAQPLAPPPAAAATATGGGSGGGGGR